MKITGGIIATGIVAKAATGKSDKIGARKAVALLKRYRDIKETDDRLYPILLKMWMHLGYSKSKAHRYIVNQVPWSAAMISYAMKDYKDFPKGAAHAVYAVASRKNKASKTGKFWMHRISEHRPKVGDIVIKRRAGANVTYDSVKVGDPTHGDLVVKVTSKGLLTIGGNVGNEFEDTFVKTQNGYITDTKYFGVIENRY